MSQIDPTNQIVLQTMSVLIEQQGLNGKLSEHELIALFGVCLREFMAEFEKVTHFLEQSPSQESVINLYKKENARLDGTKEIGAAVDTSSSTINIGSLRDIKFTQPMWEVVKGCRISGHIVKLDALANFYAARWGNSVDGTRSIDVDAHRSGSG